MWEGDYYQAIENGLCENKGQPLAIVIKDEGLYLRCSGGIVKTPMKHVSEGDDLIDAFYKAPTHSKWEVVNIV